MSQCHSATVSSTNQFICDCPCSKIWVRFYFHFCRIYVAGPCINYIRLIVSQKNQVQCSIPWGICPIDPTLIRPIVPTPKHMSNCPCSQIYVRLYIHKCICVIVPALKYMSDCPSLKIYVRLSMHKQIRVIIPTLKCMSDCPCWKLYVRLSMRKAVCPVCPTLTLTLDCPISKLDFYCSARKYRPMSDCPSSIMMFRCPCTDYMSDCPWSKLLLLNVCTVKFM